MAVAHVAIKNVAAGKQHSTGITLVLWRAFGMVMCVPGQRRPGLVDLVAMRALEHGRGLDAIGRLAIMLLMHDEKKVVKGIASFEYGGAQPQEWYAKIRFSPLSPFAEAYERLASWVVSPPRLGLGR
jgi:hypothetical protein